MSACCCVEYDDVAEVLRVVDVKRARSPHFCGECHRCIPPGAPYRLEVAVFEGELSAHKTCQLCLSVREDRMSCGFAWGEVWSDIRECMHEYGDDDDDEWLEPPDWPIEPLAGARRLEPLRSGFDSRRAPTKS